MYRSLLATIPAAALVSLTAAAPAAAVDTSDWPVPGSQPADLILMNLESQGYDVGINWVNNGKGVPLSRCNVSGYHAAGPTEPIDPAATTVYIDVVCHDED